MRHYNRISRESGKTRSERISAYVNANPHMIEGTALRVSGYARYTTPVGTKNKRYPTKNHMIAWNFFVPGLCAPQTNADTPFQSPTNKNPK
jgi:hypothetical protein